MRLEHAALPSPIGQIHALVSNGALCALGFARGWPALRERVERRFGSSVFVSATDPGGVVSCLQAYLSGDLAAAERVEIDPGGTLFQRRVWTALRAIPAGETVSYREIATGLGAPRAARAVGTANGANPIALIIPCHRVIRADGDLGGYAYGLRRKRWLLAHEGASP
jgi:methylated-DNA-[protein]-cysteine S-methyltransferase